MKYKNKYTGAVIFSSLSVRGGGWEPVKEAPTAPTVAPVKQETAAAPEKKKTTRKRTK